MSRDTQFFDLNREMIPHGLFLMRRDYLDSYADLDDEYLYIYFNTLCLYTVDRFNYLCAGENYLDIKFVKFDMNLVINLLKFTVNTFITVSYTHARGSHIFGYAKFDNDIYKLESDLWYNTETYHKITIEEIIEELNYLNKETKINLHSVVDIPPIEVAKRNLELSRNVSVKNVAVNNLHLKIRYLLEPPM